MPEMCGAAFTLTALGALGLAWTMMYALALRMVDWDLLTAPARRRVLWWRRQKVWVVVLCTAALVTGLASFLVKIASGG